MCPPILPKCAFIEVGSSFLCRVRCSGIGGTTYHANQNVVVCYDFDQRTEMPTFGEITDIVVTPCQEVLFVVQALVTDNFDQHYFAYRVHRANGDLFVCRQLDLVDSYPLMISRTFSSSNSGLYVRTKHHVFVS